LFNLKQRAADPLDGHASCTIPAHPSFLHNDENQTSSHRLVSPPLFIFGLLQRGPREIPEKNHMSDNFIALMATIAIIAVIFAWVPFLSLICPPCIRFLERRRVQKDAAKRAENAASSPMLSRRIGLRLDLDS
jgi:hypothetical protein